MPQKKGNHIEQWEAILLADSSSKAVKAQNELGKIMLENKDMLKN